MGTERQGFSPGVTGANAQPPAPAARHIAAGYQHTLVVKSDDTVCAFGNNTYSELGDNTTTIRRVPQQGAPGATLRYTTTGVDPTASDPEVPATGDVLITGTTTLKARAWVPDRAPSVVASATCTLQPAASDGNAEDGAYVGAHDAAGRTVVTVRLAPAAHHDLRGDGSTARPFEAGRLVLAQVGGTRRARAG
ncbi:MAG: chitobiase/beta-hexosaminidase C-terminal domain-containing protein [Vicinamibacterales bacterium]